MIWLQACRPKTLIASSSPVMLGTIFALREGCFHFPIFLFTLLTALGIQIGTNLANDYFDFVKGSDTALRKGPIRVTAAGLVLPQTMRWAVFFTFFATALLSSYLIWHGGFTIALWYALFICLGLAYTAGPYPLAYLGLGDLFVLIFFGPVAMAGTVFLQTQTLSWQAVLLGFGPGLISTAILTVNNLRDIEEDAQANKKTLSVRFGKRFGQIEYIASIVLAAILPLFLGYFAPLLILLPGFFLMRKLGDEKGYNTLLAQTGGLLFIYTVLLGTEIFIR